MIKLLKKFKWPDWLFTFVILGLIVGQVYADMTLTEKIGDMISMISTSIMSPITVMDVVWQCLHMLGYTILSITCTVTVGLLSSYVAARLASALRYSMFNKVNAFSMQEINKFNTSSLITRSTNDINQVQLMVMIILRMFITAPITGIWAVCKILDKSPTLTISTAIAVVSVTALAVIGVLVIVPKFAKLQKQTDNINMVSRENLTGLRVIRAYNAEPLEKEKFEQANNELTKTQKFVNQAMAVFMPALTLIMNALSLTIVWLGSYLIADGSIDIGDITAFTMYSMQIMMSFVMVVMIGIMLPRALVSAKRINAVLDEPITINDGKGAGATSGVGTIEFKDVSFKYPQADEYVLKNINLTIAHGETVAFIGSTGSGKSTLINLVPRFYEATEGQVLVDGVDVREYKQEDLHAKLGYVPQKALLFTGTIADNMRYSKDDATEEEIEHALKVAQADFVFDNPDGLNAYISQGGKNVSGGQKQRLSIARAIVRKPEIYIFDDSFSALDYKTDKALRNALSEETQSTTSLIVAQRIGTIRNADKIVVLDEGEMVGVGTHDELMASCAVYKEIALSQLSKEELA